MKKSLLTTIIFLTGLSSANAIDPGKNLKALSDAGKLSNECYTCINGTLSTVEANELACLQSNIKPGDDLSHIIAAFLSCTETELKYVQAQCDKACGAQSKMKK